jgi:hypothetical protein
MELHEISAGHAITKSDGTFCKAFEGDPWRDGFAAVNYFYGEGDATDYNIETVFTCPMC